MDWQNYKKIVAWWNKGYILITSVWWLFDHFEYLTIQPGFGYIIQFLYLQGTPFHFAVDIEMMLLRHVYQKYLLEAVTVLKMGGLNSTTISSQLPNCSRAHITNT